MKDLYVLSQEWRERYIVSLVNTVKIYGLHIVDSYGSPVSTGITSTVVPSYWWLGLPTGEQITEWRQELCSEMKEWCVPECLDHYFGFRKFHCGRMKGSSHRW